MRTTDVLVSPLRQPRLPTLPQQAPQARAAGWRHGARAGLHHRGWSCTPILVALVTLLAGQASPADQANGFYKPERLSGTLYVRANRERSYYFDYAYNSHYDDFDGKKHAYPFPPECILAAALGRAVVIKDNRILIDKAKSRAEITRVILADPRLKRVIFFNLKSLPTFRSFKRLQNGVLEAGTMRPLMIEVGLKAGDGVTRASARAEYRAQIKGKSLVVKVVFRGKGGPLGRDFRSYDIEGHARILARRK